MTRPLDPGFDPRVADWLEADPTSAPDDVLGTVLAAYPSIPQRHAPRVPWRFPPMQLRAGLAAAGAAIVVVVAMVALGLPKLSGSGAGPTPTASTAGPTGRPTSTVGATPVASATPVPTPVPTFTVNAGPTGFDRVFRSPLFGYGIRYPTGWLVTPGIQPNYPDHTPDIMENRADFFGSDNGTSGVYITAAPVTTLHPDLASFTAFIDAAIPVHYPMYAGHVGCTQSSRDLVLDGEPAHQADFFCPGHSTMWITAVHDGVAYQVAWLDDGFTVAELQPQFDEFLQSFTFAP